LGVTSILRLAAETNRSGVKAVRWANATVLAIGLLLIFLTSHSGQNNYLYPILSGLLDLSSLGPYLSLDLFFHKPFLGAWIFSYALIYYVLARLRIEHWALHLTAIYAGAYALTCLQELTGAPDELLVMICFGLASLLFPAKCYSKSKLLWVCLPVVSGLLFAA